MDVKSGDQIRPNDLHHTTPEADRVQEVLAEMVADVSERPGALPLLQFALTELFERRRGSVMTLEAYRQIGGVLDEWSSLVLGRRRKTA